MENPNTTGENNLFLNILLIGCFITIAVTYYLFYIQKDYNFIVEVYCDPSIQTCSSRDCDSEDSDCPSNNLSFYKNYKILASDFNQCTNEDCADICRKGVIACIELECTEDQDFGISCIGPLENNEVTLP